VEKDEKAYKGISENIQKEDFAARPKRKGGRMKFLTE